MEYEKGDHVITTREIGRGIAFRHLRPVRVFANPKGLATSIAAGTPGTVVEHIVDLIVSFDEPDIVGRAIPPDAVEPA